MIELRHGRVRLALHEIHARAGTPLLLLHELGASGMTWKRGPLAWDGPVFALDFSGHGQSAPAAGGAYTPELLAGDADAALAHLGRAVVAGAGVGAYVAMLLAAGRAESVRAALLVPGRGLHGGGPVPDFSATKLQFLESPEAFESADCDPMVGFLEHDIRPVEYAQRIARGARRLLLLENNEDHPPWWQCLREDPNATVVTGSVDDALQQLSVHDSSGLSLELERTRKTQPFGE